MRKQAIFLFFTIASAFTIDDLQKLQFDCMKSIENLLLSAKKLVKILVRMQVLTKDIYTFNYFHAQEECDMVIHYFLEKFSDEFEQVEHDLEEELKFVQKYLSPFG